MHLDALTYEHMQRPSRKGKERDSSFRDPPQKEPQPTDIDEKLMALRRRTAGPLRSRDRSDRERSQPAQLSPSTSRPDRPPRVISTSPTSKPSPTSPRRISSSHVIIARTADADHEEFSRRLKISTPHALQPHSGKLASSSKLFNPDTDPIPMRRTTEPTFGSDHLNGLHGQRASVNGAATLISSHHRDDRGVGQRQLFDYRKDDPVKFSVLNRPQQPAKNPPTPTPKPSGDHVSASSISSYAPSVASSITLSSTTDSSTSSALFDSQGQAHEQSSSNAFSVQLKLLYRQITSLENNIKQEDSQDDAEDVLEARVMIRGREMENIDVETEKWKRRINDHKKLADVIHELLRMSLAHNVPASLRQIPTKYNIIVRLWTFAFHRLLESLRRSSVSSRVALEHLQGFIYYAYSFYAILLEDQSLDTFKNGWLEALGDLARYHMAVAAMITGGIGSSGSTTLTSKAIHDAGISGNIEPGPSTGSLPPPTTAAAAAFATDDTDAEARLVRLDGGPSPSVGVVAARLLEVKPEKERWRSLAREWYNAGLSEQPGTGKLHHHLGLLSREVDGEELRGVYHFVKSMTTLHPFSTARESVLPLWSGPAQARRFLPDTPVPDLFVLLHGMLFTNIQLDDFQSALARFIERLELDGADEREWIMMAIINIGAILEYGKPGGILRRAGGITVRETEPGAQNQGTLKVVTRKNAGSTTSASVMAHVENMDIDEEHRRGGSLIKQPTLPTVDQSPNLSGSIPHVLLSNDFNYADLPAPFLLALQLTFSMLSHVLRRPMLKSSIYAHSDINPYLTVLLTFLITMIKHPAALHVLERAIPWEELAAFFAKAPKRYMNKQGLWNMPNERAKWAMITNGCSPPLPEDWCMRGMEWVGRKVFERGYWKLDSTSEECRTEAGVLSKDDPAEASDGKIEDDDEDMEQVTANHADGQLRQVQQKNVMSRAERRWVRALRCGVVIAEIVDGFTWTVGTRNWTVEGKLSEKVGLWKEQERMEEEEEEKRRMKQRWAEDSMDVDDAESADSEESEDDENDSEEVRALKARRKYLRSLLQSTQRPGTSTTSSAQRLRSTKKAISRPRLHIVPGYTVLVVDTNILLSSLAMFSSVVESLQWTIIVPLPVVMELDGLASNTSPLGEVAQQAISYITSHVRTHGLSLKVQTSKGNYLSNLTVRTEQVDFVDGGGMDSERNMDDLILKAAIWQDEHWVDRSGLLGKKQKTEDSTSLGMVRVALLTLDRNLRLKARSRQLPAASEKDLAFILTNAT
ncbi:hypothetical protein AX17_004365 [Amanita inopinata Kibby_2008]|nr:hypothetical protein AX17_004365 [Amanita inopinata Kibby_2008]